MKMPISIQTAAKPQIRIVACLFTYSVLPNGSILPKQCAFGKARGNSGQIFLPRRNKPCLPSFFGGRLAARLASGERGRHNEHTKAKANHAERSVEGIGFHSHSSRIDHLRYGLRFINFSLGEHSLAFLVISE